MTPPEDSPATHTEVPSTSGKQPLDDTESVTATIINRILARENISSNDLVPLYEVIDPDALNTLFGPTRAGSHRPTTGAVTFQYQGYQVTVTSENDVELELLQDD
ncbi:HalOD1 output domain-containing protein [Haladaptatus sp. DYF46]|uniref:HalOD1 output domain-containing protein n=1 Tax=Haladaptatus sp. DYF46 TaxID=2886041 RepID=UPI001E36C8EA|nr:HalOD1 output domain-containing protein [Haladaptatus sp. DYF46]